MSGHVYVIRAGTKGPVKIGYSDNPTRRLEQLQGAHHETLEILTQFPATTVDEEALHTAAKELGLHLRGEWFTLSDSLLEAVETARWDAAARQIALKTRDAAYKTIERVACDLAKHGNPMEPLDEALVRATFDDAASDLLRVMEEFRVEALGYADAFVKAAPVSALDAFDREEAAA